MILARSKEPLEKLSQNHTKQVRALAGDLNDFSLAQKAVDVAIEDFGQLNGLVVNHGAMFGVKRLVDCDVDEWRKMFDINFFSAVAFVSHPYMASTVSYQRKDQGSFTRAAQNQGLYCVHVIRGFIWSVHCLGCVHCLQVGYEHTSSTSCM